MLLAGVKAISVHCDDEIRPCEMFVDGLPVKIGDLPDLSHRISFLP